MDQLWAPWRLSYVAQPSKPKSDDPCGDCFICHGLMANDDRASLIAYRSELSTIVLNRFPYNNGHVLIAPKAHKAKPSELTDAETLDLQQLITRVMAAFDKTMKPDGYNVGLNLGRVAGAGLPGHLHWHVVPRWSGDINFMPILGETAVMVQSLDALWELLSNEFKVG